MALPWQPADARLIARVRDGDEQAFEQIYERYGVAILAFSTHLTGQREEAEDAVQHTFLAAYRQILSSSEPLELRPWLFTVARNRCLTQLRSRADRALAFDVPNPDVAGLAEQVERREELRQLVADLRMLPEPQRVALLLSQLDAMPYSEIGQVLGVEPEKVKSLVFQARSSLASTREAREAPCVDVRQQLATARGAALRRRALRRHVRVCTGCREYETIVRRQRRALDQLLPVPPSVALTGSVLGAIGREGGAGAGGAAVVASGGAGGSIAGTVAALGGSGLAKIAVVATVVGSGGAGAVAADLPERISGDRPPEWTASPDPIETPVPVDSNGGRLRDDVGGGPRAEAKNGRGRDRQAGDPAKEPATTLDDDPMSADDGPRTPVDGNGDPAADGTPPGLVKHGGVPPGQAKKGDGWIPPGQAKKQGGAAPGKAQGQGPGNGNGNGQANGGGQGNGNGNGNGAAGQGNDNAGGQGNGQGQGQANSGGQGNGNAGGQGNGQGGGNGQGQGNGNGNGNG